MKIRIIPGRSRHKIIFSSVILIIIISTFVTSGLGTELPARDITIYPWEPITNQHVLPNNLPRSAQPGRTLSVQACPGEYEPTSFIIRAGEHGLEDVEVISTELTLIAGKSKNLGKASISPDNLDMRVVKCWYKLEGEGLFVLRKRKKVLIPELLLHDDSLVSVNETTKTNEIRSFFCDSDRLVSFKVRPRENKQLWINCFVPPETIPGLYKGKILVRCLTKNVSADLDLFLEVLPFTLAPSAVDYAIYYRGKLSTPQAPPSLGSESKTKLQMQAELRDIMAHGFKYATIYQSIYDDGQYHFDMLDAVLRLRQEVGLPNSPFFFMALAIDRDRSGNPNMGELEKELDLLFSFLRKKNIGEIYIYGWDEAEGENLRKQRPFYGLIREKGGKVFVACSKGYFNIAGDLIDLPIYYEGPPRDLIEAVHRKGFKIWVYHLPQGGLEDPVIYRRNYGFKLWQSGADGVCLYPYQHVFGDIWNEFGNHDYKNHMMTYPTVNGVIPTIQWAGMREGVDDVRYLSTLLKESRKHGSKEAETTEKWLWGIDSTKEESRSIRKKIISKILELRNKENK